MVLQNFSYLFLNNISTVTNSSLVDQPPASLILRYTVTCSIATIAILVIPMYLFYIWVVKHDEKLISISFYKITIFMAVMDLSQIASLASLFVLLTVKVR